MKNLNKKAGIFNTCSARQKLLWRFLTRWRTLKKSADFVKTPRSRMRYFERVFLRKAEKFKSNSALQCGVFPYKETVRKSRNFFLLFSLNISNNLTFSYLSAVCTFFDSSSRYF